MANALHTTQPTIIVCHLSATSVMQYLDCRSGCIRAQSESQDSCPVTCVS